MNFIFSLNSCLLLRLSATVNMQMAKKVNRSLLIKIHFFSCLRNIKKKVTKFPEKSSHHPSNSKKISKIHEKKKFHEQHVKNIKMFKKEKNMKK